MVGHHSETVEAHSGREVGCFETEEVHSEMEEALRFEMMGDRSEIGVENLVHQVAGIVEGARMPRYSGIAAVLGG